MARKLNGGETLNNYLIIVRNGSGCEIDKQLIFAPTGEDALMQYLKEFKPMLENGDTIEIF